MRTYSRRLLAGAAVVASFGAVQAWADSGFYIGGGLGEAKLQENDNFQGTHVNFDESDTAIKLFGGYMFNKWLGVELSAEDFGKPEKSFHLPVGAGIDKVNVDANVSGYTGELLGQIPLGHFNLFAKGGMIYYDAEINAKDVTVGLKATAHDSDYKFTLGGGVGLDVGKLTFRVEYQYLDVGDGIDAVFASGILHF
jgi:opacity protein-like surface antigen